MCVKEEKKKREKRIISFVLVYIFLVDFGTYYVETEYTDNNAIVRCFSNINVLIETKEREKIKTETQS